MNIGGSGADLKKKNGALSMGLCRAESSPFRRSSSSSMWRCSTAPRCPLRQIGRSGAAHSGGRRAEQAAAECLREGIGLDLVLEIDAAGQPIGPRGAPESERLIPHGLEPLAKPTSPPA